jgi:SAM-dependent methyltransferase
MARRGYQVTGIDLSADMLEAARQDAEARGVAITLTRRDMRELGFNREFDAAYILFNTISLLAGNDELIAFLKTVHAALKPGGLFIVQVGNLWPGIAGGKLANGAYEGDEERGGIRRHRKMEFIIGPYNNLMRHLDHKRYWRDEEELEPKYEERLLRIFSLNELDLLCRLSGFTIQEVFGDTDISTKIVDANITQNIEGAYRSYVLIIRKR